jgi:hypothetical protein
MRRHFRSPSASTVIASIALIVALGGTSYAASQITGSNIKNNSVTGKDVRNSSLTTSDIKNGSLRSKDFKKGDIPAGPKGPAGSTGPAGPTGTTSLVYRDGVEVAIGPKEEGVAEAVCPDGLIPTGGGAFSTVPDDPDGEPPWAASDITINSSYPFADEDEAGWAVIVENQTSETQYTTVTVICAPGEIAEASKKMRRR